MPVAARLVSDPPIPPSRRQDMASARAAGLRYVTDAEDGIQRLKKGPGFLYRDARGRPIDARTRARIRSLVIPPAWTDVWIAADPRAHLQATGRDARGRKQYRYHPRWVAVREAAKYDHLREFGRALPLIPARVARDLRARPLSRPWVLATVARLLEQSVIRVGNDEYRRANGSYGLTTLRNHHVVADGGTVRLEFRAKSGVLQTVEVVDAVLARRLRQCQGVPGYTLFQYIDDSGRARAVTAADVNRYLRDAAGGRFTAKDFRTWAGTLEMSRQLDRAIDNCPPSERARKRELIKALDAVAARLGNTRAVCRRCYVHPVVLNEFFNGRTLSAVKGRRGPQGLGTDERALLALLEAPLEIARSA
jgi:DNA topoisomerase-1